jgi:uncharacterized protein (DUF58 family)
VKLRARFFLWALYVVVSFAVMQLALRPFAYAFFFFALLLAPVSLLVALYQRSRLHIEFSEEMEYVPRGQKVSWVLALTNPLYQTLRIEEDQPFLLQAKSNWRRTYSRSASHTGPTPSPRPTLWMSDPMGFFQLKLSYEKPNDIYVLPHPVSWTGPALGMGDLLSVIQRPVSGMSDVSEWTSSRLLRPGDPMKRIHWKLSSRLQEWVVREEEGHMLSHIVMLLDMPEEFQEDLSKRDDFLDRVAGLKLQSAAAEHAHLRAYLPMKTHTKFFQSQEVLKQLARIPLDSYLSLEQQMQQEFNLPHALYLILTPRKDIDIAALLNEQRGQWNLAFHSLAKEDPS